MKHPYADILIALAEGKEIQWKRPQGGWELQDADAVLNEIFERTYSVDNYRIKPATITVNNVTCEAPVEDGRYTLQVRIPGTFFEWGFATTKARDAACDALVKPFEEAK